MEIVKVGKMSFSVKNQMYKCPQKLMPLTEASHNKTMNIFKRLLFLISTINKKAR